MTVSGVSRMKTPYSKNSHRMAAAAPRPVHVRASVQDLRPAQRRRAAPAAALSRAQFPKWQASSNQPTVS
ncbi:hypothetical protein ACFQY7_46315 [Actinomadura luteofluorescens]|uniref:hypothetical protein n=1 Tax=Actinomadura luteofluorescens TaxID=46163 RepID=UPI00362AF4ED